MAALGQSHIRQGKRLDAEPVLRECMAMREKSQPEDWSTFNTRTFWGPASSASEVPALAEPLVLSGYQGMKMRETKIPPPGLPRLKEAAERVVELYEAWGKKEK